ncbi:Rne/Rng family ribonuclease [Pseudohoeflea suaedae]|uniref:Ribonuclease E n=1 Tax=Pseudohoeflea suaedae TaxID=877384 RepID=A0A4R5PPX9_9HYPH|nr:Rne/Rng family ribonuclease [Pseudohoeflea suaedae]TDH39162.1 Rne/Rng family ribonuclease [Pseudohoeflea suaedae]
MSEKMLIDASHPEETRVVVVRGNRIEEFDFESQHKKQLRGNIYLAKVTRVEPSLQAAFVDYGGNRHGFLAFSEIHPDYYQIPLADRQALLEEEAAEARAEDDDDDERAARSSRGRKGKSRDRNASKASEQADSDDTEDKDGETAEASGDEDNGKERRSRRSRRSRRKPKDAAAASDENADQDASSDDNGSEEAASDDQASDVPAAENPADIVAESLDTPNDASDDAPADTKKPDTMAAEVEADEISEPVEKVISDDDDGDDSDDDGDDNGDGPKAKVESVGSEDALEEVPDRSRRKQRKQYRIQEVIKRRQILLVQVVKEERGNKGAALTTYLSLAGRYSVLMPNTARGGGISRKITNVTDRKRLKEIARELEVPQGMGVILRTAGANRTKVEIKRDFEYLMRLWDNVRNLTLKSTAPALVYEEGSLIKRSIRDLYNKDISEIVVSGEEGYREAKDFMKMLMPSHAKVVQPYKDLMPIFARSGIDAQLDKMVQPQVTLKSGGYIIINQTEALVAIDVNSGRSTREHSIEDTALQTNLEAAEEVARQLRLRDLAGLIVIDFIDMEENRNNRAVEKRVKECLKHDRARIQVGRISHFGLLEMSRQRIRASVLESTMQVCAHCGGTGHVRSPSSVALHVLRGIEEYLLKHTTHHITVRTTGETALYMLNNKRDTIIDLETRFGLTIAFASDPDVGSQHFAIDRGAPVDNPVTLEHIHANSPSYEEEADDDVVIDTDDEEEASEARSNSSDDDRSQDEDNNKSGRRRRRRRRRGRRGNEGDASAQGSDDQSNDDDADDDTSDDDGSDDQSNASGQDGDDNDHNRSGKKRRRGKRGGRRNRDDNRQSSDENGQQWDDEEIDTTPQPDPKPEQKPQAEPAVAAAEADAEVKAEEAPASDESKAEADEGKTEKKKPARPRRSRSKKADAEKEAAEAKADDAKADDKPAEDAMAAEEMDVAAAATAPVAEAEPVAADASADSEDAPKRDRKAQTDLSAIATAPVVTSSGTDEKKDDKPKKGGWWQRRGGGGFF